jgi:hypothetical protein
MTERTTTATERRLMSPSAGRVDFTSRLTSKFFSDVLERFFAVSVEEAVSLDGCVLRDGAAGG